MALIVVPNGAHDNATNDLRAVFLEAFAERCASAKPVDQIRFPERLSAQLSACARKTYVSLRCYLCRAGPSEPGSLL